MRQTSRCGKNADHEPLSSMDQLTPMAPFDVTFGVSTPTTVKDEDWDKFCAAAAEALDAETKEQFPFLRAKITHCADGCGMCLDHGSPEVPPLILFRSDTDYPGPTDPSSFPFTVRDPYARASGSSSTTPVDEDGLDGLLARDKEEEEDDDREQGLQSSGKTGECPVPDPSIAACAERLGGKSVNIATAWPGWIPPYESVVTRDEESESQGTDRAVFIVATRLARGYCVSVKIHHSIADGASLAMFVNAWSARTKQILLGSTGGSPAAEGRVVVFDTTVMTGDPSRHDPDHPPRIAKGSMMPIPVMNEQFRTMYRAMIPKVKVYTALYTRATVESLRSLEGCGAYTSNDFIGGQCLKDAAECAARLGIDKTADGSPRNLTLNFPANLRPKIDTIPDRLFGNALTFCATDPLRFSHVRESPLRGIAEAISTAKAKGTSQTEINRIIDWEASRGDRPRGLPFTADPATQTFVLTNWAHLPLFDADWGMGTLEIATPFNELNYHFLGYILPTKRKGEMVAYYFLPEETPPRMPGA